MIQKLWIHAPQAIGAKLRKRITSTVRVMYFEKYCPNTDLLSLSRSGGQIIIATETTTGGTKPTMMAGAIRCCQKKVERYRCHADIRRQFQRMNLVIELSFAKIHRWPFLYFLWHSPQFDCMDA